jgi:hypothetical protein
MCPLSRALLALLSWQGYWPPYPAPAKRKNEVHTLPGNRQTAAGVQKLVLLVINVQVTTIFPQFAYKDKSNRRTINVWCKSLPVVVRTQRDLMEKEQFSTKQSKRGGRRVPRVGDRFVFSGCRFEVLEMNGRRVDKVRASREPAVEP